MNARMSRSRLVLTAAWARIRMLHQIASHPPDGLMIAAIISPRSLTVCVCGSSGDVILAIPVLVRLDAAVPDGLVRVGAEPAGLVYVHDALVLRANATLCVALESAPARAGTMLRIGCHMVSPCSARARRRCIQALTQVRDGGSNALT
jgi:hypothetical protein